MLDRAVALTCYARATEYLAETPECAEHALGEVVARLHTDVRRETPTGRGPRSSSALAIARRVGSPGMEAMAVQGLAHMAATAGEVG